MLHDELDNLRRVVTGVDNALQIDDALLPLVARRDPRVVTLILLLLNENGDQDGMWSILHTAESFGDNAYVAALLSALPTLIQTCHWWATVLLTRIANSEGCRAEMMRQLRKAPAATKQAATTIFDKINGSDIRFLAKTTPLLVAAKA